MEDLKHCIKNGLYRPIQNAKLKDSKEFSKLIKAMLHVEHRKRAMIKDIITNRSIVGAYYRKYFDFGFDVYFGLYNDSLFHK